MAQAAKAHQNRLIPSPKELDKALTLSADRARRMADAFGLKVPGAAPKAVKKSADQEESTSGSN